MSKKFEIEKRKCGDCVHLYACQLWNNGRLENTEADHCTVYETIKDTVAYYIGLCDGRKINAENSQSRT